MGKEAASKLVLNMGVSFPEEGFLTLNMNETFRKKDYPFQKSKKSEREVRKLWSGESFGMVGSSIDWKGWVVREDAGELSRGLAVETFSS